MGNIEETYYPELAQTLSLKPFSSLTVELDSHLEHSLEESARREHKPLAARG